MNRNREGGKGGGGVREKGNEGTAMKRFKGP